MVAQVKNQQSAYSQNDTLYAVFQFEMRWCIKVQWMQHHWRRVNNQVNSHSLIALSSMLLVRTNFISYRHVGCAHIHRQGNEIQNLLNDKLKRPRPVQSRRIHWAISLSARQRMHWRFVHATRNSVPNNCSQSSEIAWPVTWTALAFAILLCSPTICMSGRFRPRRIYFTWMFYISQGWTFNVESAFSCPFARIHWPHAKIDSIFCLCWRTKQIRVLTVTLASLRSIFRPSFRTNFIYINRFATVSRPLCITQYYLNDDEMFLSELKFEMRIWFASTDHYLRANNWI